MSARKQDNASFVSIVMSLLIVSDIHRLSTLKIGLSAWFDVVLAVLGNQCHEQL